MAVLRQRAQLVLPQGVLLVVIPGKLHHLGGEEGRETVTRTEIFQPELWELMGVSHSLLNPWPINYKILIHEEWGCNQRLDEVSNSSFLAKNLAHLTPKPHFSPWPCKPSGNCRKLSPSLNFQPFSGSISIPEWLLKWAKIVRPKLICPQVQGEAGLKDCTEVFILLINRIHSQRANP